MVGHMHKHNSIPLYHPLWTVVLGSIYQATTAGPDKYLTCQQRTFKAIPYHFKNHLGSIGLSSSKELQTPLVFFRIFHVWAPVVQVVEVCDLEKETAKNCKIRHYNTSVTAAIVKGLWICFQWTCMATTITAIIMN